MAHRVCPWWLGLFLASPIRKLRHNPLEILRPYVREGMIVLEPGPGMGFFTLELARIVGEKGKVVAIDVQKRMIESLRRRSQKARMNDRIELRLAGPAGMGVSDLVGKVDFVLAFAVAHEMPDIGQFFKESFEALKANGKLLLSEPADHIEESEFNESVSLARSAGFTMTERPQIKSNLSAVLAKSAPGKQ